MGLALEKFASQRSRKRKSSNGITGHSYARKKAERGGDTSGNYGNKEHPATFESRIEAGRKQKKHMLESRVREQKKKNIGNDRDKTKSRQTGSGTNHGGGKTKPNIPGFDSYRSTNTNSTSSAGTKSTNTGSTSSTGTKSANTGSSQPKKAVSMFSRLSKKQIAGGILATGAIGGLAYYNKKND